MKRKPILLQHYVVNRGLFARVARQLGVDPSYVSRVASGKRRSKTISRALDAELAKMNATIRELAQRSGKRSESRPRN